MYRVELISNKSVEEDIVEALEHYIPDLQYSSIPLVYGRGGDDRKMGTATWPETNFIMISYIQDQQLETFKKVIAAIKQKFSSEGIKMFVIKSED